MEVTKQWPTARDREHLKGLARAFAGAIIFSLPLLMTMEMWELGFYLDRLMLAQFVAMDLFVLVGLSRVAGFERTRGWFEDVLDAFAAFAVAVFASVCVLALFAVIRVDMATDEVIGKVAIQSVPASFGAMIANRQLGARDGRQVGDQDRSSYGGELFLMVAGALFLSFNVAPTEEMVLIAYQMTYWHGLALVLISILLMHAFVYGVGFAGQHEIGDEHALRIFVRYSLVGYAIAALVSLYALWTFGRTVDSSAETVAMVTAVLAFPSAIGAAIARLVV